MAWGFLLLLFCRCAGLLQLPVHRRSGPGVSSRRCSCEFFFLVTSPIQSVSFVIFFSLQTLSESTCADLHLLLGVAFSLLGNLPLVVASRLVACACSLVSAGGFSCCCLLLGFWGPLGFSVRVDDCRWSPISAGHRSFAAGMVCRLIGEFSFCGGPLAASTPLPFPSLSPRSSSLPLLPFAHTHHTTQTRTPQNTQNIQNTHRPPPHHTPLSSLLCPSFPPSTPHTHTHPAGASFLWLCPSQWLLVDFALTSKYLAATDGVAMLAAMLCVATFPRCLDD